jgi:hypothetical protein
MVVTEAECVAAEKYMHCHARTRECIAMHAAAHADALDYGRKLRTEWLSC